MTSQSESKTVEAENRLRERVVGEGENGVKTRLGHLYFCQVRRINIENLQCEKLQLRAIINSPEITYKKKKGKKKER